MIVAPLYMHHSADPFFNMAFDEWMLGWVLARPGVILVRLYSWSPGAITFGLNQREVSAYDHAALGDTPVIRRVTGGRAIYHDPSEITYSVALNTRDLNHERLAGGISQSSTAIAETLAEFVRLQGVTAAYQKQSAADNARPEFFHTAPCFASHARYELMAAGRKVVASAQRRLDDSFLQHGSIKLAGIVNHLALGGLSETVNEKLQPVTEEQFSDLSRPLGEAFKKVLRIRLNVTLESNENIPGLSEVIAGVRKNASNKRDIIKQSANAGSL